MTFGDTRLAHGYEDNDKLFKVDNACGPSICVAGTAAHFPVLRKALTAHAAETLRLGTQATRSSTPSRKLHPDAEGHTSSCKPRKRTPTRTRSSQFTRADRQRRAASSASTAYREVFEFEHFWGIGSGRSFALGAMHAAYDKAHARRSEIAEAGVAAGCEFDQATRPPRCDVSHDSN